MEFILERTKKNLFIVNVASYIGNTIIISGDNYYLLSKPMRHVYNR